jgi:hypothetical protein
MTRLAWIGLILICLTALLGGVLAGSFQPGLAARPAAPPGATPVPEESALLEDAILRAVQERAEAVLAFLVYQVAIEQVEISLDGAWAAARLMLLERDTGQVVPAEPGLALAQRRAGGWQITLQADAAWARLLEQVPASLISEADKQAWADSYLLACDTAGLGTFDGYLLPWAAGTSKRLSRSITHTLPPGDNPSNSMFYSFDFYDASGGLPMFRVYASKSGTVKWARWSQENGDPSSPGNYIVLEDKSTNPDTYALYLHLAKNSIPDELRVIGAPVQQGEFLGMADDTGYSTANHLHFQVHNEPASYWGCSLDIVFDDVDINGGRPRTVTEASSYPEHGKKGQADYVSQNVVRDDLTPPVGDMLVPFVNGFHVQDGTLYLEAWASDDISGLANAWFIANWDGAWRTVSPALNSPILSYDWDLCASGAPPGPLAVALRLQDYANNTTSDLPGLRLGMNNSDCPVPPPACSPGAGQAALFASPDYQGACVVLSAGDYPDGASLGSLGVDNLAAIRLGSGAQVTLYSLPGFTGRSQTIRQNESGLADDPIGADTVDSLRVLASSTAPGVPHPGWPVSGTLYTDKPTIGLAWSDSAATEFQARITGAASLTSTWQTSASWIVGSLPAGSYAWQVRARSSGGTSAWSAAQAFTIQPGTPFTPPQFTAPFSDDLESSQANWQASGAWTYLDDANASHSPSHSWSFQNYNSGLPASGDLTSPLIAIPNIGYELRFWYRYQTEGPGLHWDQRWLQISVNGGAFQNVLQLSDDQPGAWLHSPPLDLSPYAGQVIQARFSFHTLDAIANQHPGWIIDDLSVQPGAPTPCIAGFEPNNTPAAANSLAFDQPLTADICPPGDIDFFVFTGQAGDHIEVDIDAQTISSTLDSYLFLYDSDGRSQLAQNDDEVLYERTDSHLGYRLLRSGTYYLKLRAWDHPGAGGTDYPYQITLREDNLPPSVSFLNLENNAIFPNGAPQLNIQAEDVGSGISHVAVWWHTADWLTGAWQPVGQDWDGSDGWQVTFQTGAVAEQDHLGFSVLAYDWAGNAHVDTAWDVVLDLTPPQTALQPLPATVESSAFVLRWSGTDNRTSIGQYDLQGRASGVGSWTDLGSFPGAITQAWYIGQPGETVGFRLRGVDAAGNPEALPDDPEIQTAILACTAPDAWDAAPQDDDHPAAATVFTLGEASQTHNLCQPGDQDWLTFALTGGVRYTIFGLPLQESSAVELTLYATDGLTTTQVASFKPAGFDQAALLHFQPAQDGQYLLKVNHIDSRIAGNAVTYLLAIAPSRVTYLPVHRR